jgi:hypothetical protein
VVQEYAKIGEQMMGMMGGGAGASMGAVGGGESGAGGFTGGSGGAGSAGGGLSMPGAPPGGMPGMPGMPGFDPSKLGGQDWAEMTAAAQNMMKDYLQPEKLKVVICLKLQDTVR